MIKSIAALFAITLTTLSPNAYCQKNPKHWKKPLLDPIGRNWTRCDPSATQPDKGGIDALPAGQGSATARVEWALDQCEIIDPKVRKLFTHYYDHVKEKLLPLPTNRLKYPSFAQDDRTEADSKNRIYKVWLPDYNSCSLAVDGRDEEAIWFKTCFVTPTQTQTGSTEYTERSFEASALNRLAMRKAISAEILD